MDARRRELRRQLAPHVSPSVMRELVGGTPEPRVLWDGDENASAWFRRLGHLPQDENVLFHVLDHVERPDEVELRVERDTSSIHLDELGIREPTAGDREASRRQL